MASTSSDDCGYDANFTAAIPEELECVICHLVLRDPVQIMTCGHRFCAMCFERMKTHSVKTNTDLLCPVDRDAVMLGQVLPDRAAARTIGNFKVHCRNHDHGCVWNDDLRNLRNHEERCEFNGASEADILTTHEEVNVTLKQILLRLQTYEKDLLMNNKELSELNLTVSELTEDKKLKEEEIRLLKISNVELKDEATMRKNEISELKKSINELQNELEYTKQLNNHHGEAIVEHQTIDLNELHMSDSVWKEITSIKEEVEAMKKTKTPLVTEYIDNVQFEHQPFETANYISLNWVMQDYLHMFRIGKPVFSPAFHTVIGGYSFQLSVEWQGPNKSMLVLFLGLLRGATPYRFLKEFNHEFTLTLHGKGGRNISKQYTQTHIAENQCCFVIKNGKDTPDRNAGCTMLTAPFDDFIVNNALLISCNIIYAI